MERLVVSVKNGVKIIKFCKPERKNAINKDVYKKLTDILNEDAHNDSIVVTILTGEGEYFTSGNDIKDTMNSSDDRDLEIILKEANNTIKSFVQSFINYPKLLIAVVNGPAIGIGSTIVALCDITYASERATFHTPFVQLGLCCEGCSSYTYPLYMGRSKASEMLLLGKRITAQEAFQNNLIARVISHEKLGELFEELQEHGKIPLKSLLINKKLLMENFKKTLHDSNIRECEHLLERTASEDFSNAIASFLSRKSKL